MMDELGPVDYNNSTPPANYKCFDCDIHGVKLWRMYQTFLDHNDLLCADCAEKEQKKERQEEYGYIWDGEKFVHRDCDQIGWRIPAVPTIEGDTYWGYTSVPQDGVEWWWRLKTRKEILDDNKYEAKSESH